MQKTIVTLNADGTQGGSQIGALPYDYNPAVLSQRQPVLPVLVDSGVDFLEIERVSSDQALENLLPLDEQSPAGSQTTFTTRVLINPYAEQIITGTQYGEFVLNEQAFQSTWIPRIINGLSVSGATATEYEPVIGIQQGTTTSYLGRRAGQFKGSLLDTDTKAAGISLASFASSGTTCANFLLESFVYFESTPSSAYDPIIITRSTDGVTPTTNDSFRLEYDNTSSQLQFHFATQSYASAGYEPVMLAVCPTNGVTLNEWHHFAIAYSNRGGSAAIASYWNGNRIGKIAGLSGNIRNSTASVCVGCGASGDKPLKGWLEDLAISCGGETAALRSFSAFGLTATIPTDEISAGEYTVRLLSMNGPLGHSIFPCESEAKVISSVVYLDRPNSTVGAALVSRNETSLHGICLFGGFCGGHQISGGSAGYYFGYDSGACIIVGDVKETRPLPDAKKVRGNGAEFTISFLLGYTAMRGYSGSSGDFSRLFKRNWGGNSFSYLPIESNIRELRTYFDDIVYNGNTGTFYIKDYDTGTVYGVVSADVRNLYQDIVEYHTKAIQLGVSMNNTISSKSSFSQLRSVSGFVEEGLARKVAPGVADVGVVFVSPPARASKKTNRPEGKYQINEDEILPLEEELN
jgi:hypothetical protein